MHTDLEERRSYDTAWKRAERTTLSSWAKYAIKQLRHRAKKAGLSFDLEPSDIVIPEVCPITLLPFVLGQGKMHRQNPSVDRINPRKGYVKGNVRVISAIANRLKQDVTDPAVFKRLSDYVRGVI